MFLFLYLWVEFFYVPLVDPGTNFMIELWLLVGVNLICSGIHSVFFFSFGVGCGCTVF